MRPFQILSLYILCLFCLRNVKSLTKSMGQEVIEIGAPIKDLPDLEEEPSVENEEDKVTSTTNQAATKKDMRKYSDMNKKLKDVDKIDGRKQEDDEARIEKELADIYKDSVDYKADSAEVVVTKGNVTMETETQKPIARTRDQFKFQPDSNNPKDVARFRTSIDEISCSKSQLAGVTKAPTSGCRRIIYDTLFLSVLTFCVNF